MKILVVGSGAREHTFVWKIVQSPLVEKVYCVPGESGYRPDRRMSINSPRRQLLGNCGLCGKRKR